MENVNLKKTWQQEENSTVLEYGLKMLVVVASATHHHDSKTVEEITRLVRRRLEQSSVFSAS